MSTIKSTKKYLDLNGAYIKQKQVFNANDVSMDDLNLGKKPDSETNVLFADIKGLTNGKITKIGSSDASTLTNSPITSGVFVAVKEICGGSGGAGHLFVRLTEIYPLPGRIWINTYNNSWIGWREFNPNSDKFSSSELDTGQTWIDSKRMYRKVISFSSFTGPTTVSVAHGISSISAVTSISGIAKSENTYVVLPRGHRDSKHDGISINVDSTKVELDVGTSNSFDSATVTVEYTK